MSLLEPSELAAVAGRADTCDRAIRDFAQLNARLDKVYRCACSGAIWQSLLQVNVNAAQNVE